MFRWKFMGFNLLSFFLFNCDQQNPEGYNCLGGVIFCGFFFWWVCFSLLWSSGFLQKYLPFRFKKTDKVFNKMIISRGQTLFCAEAFCPVGREGRGDIKNVWAESRWCDGIASNAKEDLLNIISREKIVFSFFFFPLACVIDITICLSFLVMKVKLLFLQKQTLVNQKLPKIRCIFYPWRQKCQFLSLKGHF